MVDDDPDNIARSQTSLKRILALIAWILKREVVDLADDIILSTLCTFSLTCL